MFIFDRQRLTRYSGWRVILAASLAMACTLPGRTHALGIITMPLLVSFPTLTETSYASINLVATLLGSLFCLPCGWMTDRYGPRIVGTVCVFLLGILVCWMSHAETCAMLALGILLTRSVGQSMLSVISLSIIGRAFLDRSSIAMGLYAMILTVLMAVGTGLLMSQVSIKDWRVAWNEQGLCLLILAPILGWLLSRTITEHHSKVEFVEQIESNKPTSKVLESSATLRQALCSACFWQFAICISFFGLTSSGISLFQQSILVERGLNQQVFQVVVIGGLLIGLLANLLGSWLARRFPLQKLLGIAMIILSGSLFSIPHLTTPSHAYLYCLGYAASGGMITVLFFSVWGQAFGTSHLGRIQGAAQMLTVVASSVGPLLISHSHQTFNRHNEAACLLAMVAILLGFCSFFVSVPSAANGDWSKVAAFSSRV